MNLFVCPCCERELKTLFVDGVLVRIWCQCGYVWPKWYTGQFPNREIKGGDRSTWIYYWSWRIDDATAETRQA